MHSLVTSFVDSCTHSLVTSFVDSYTHSLVTSFVDSYTHSLVTSFVDSYTHSLVTSFVYYIVGNVAWDTGREIPNIFISLQPIRPLKFHRVQIICTRPSSSHIFKCLLEKRVRGSGPKAIIVHVYSTIT